jgi:hypothetical protein
MATQSVKTRVWNDIELTRHVRPYRLAVIELVFTTAGAAPTFRVVFSEFGNNIVSNPSFVAAGVYTLNVASGIFSKLENVVTSSTITYNATTSGGVIVDLYSTSYFTNATYSTVRLVTATIAGTNTNTNFVGKIFLNIKEYYG